MHWKKRREHDRVKFTQKALLNQAYYSSKVREYAVSDIVREKSCHDSFGDVTRKTPFFLPKVTEVRYLRCKWRSLHGSSLAARLSFFKKYRHQIVATRA
jgi:hypothetical protein